jgi:hypothetical protein
VRGSSPGFSTTTRTFGIISSILGSGSLGEGVAPAQGDAILLAQLVEQVYQNGYGTSKNNDEAN